MYFGKIEMKSSDILVLTHSHCVAIYSVIIKKGRMRTPRLILSVSLLLLFCWFLVQPAQGTLRKVRIPDQLDDVVDDEEDEEWKAWGTPKPKPKLAFDPPPDFVDGMDLSQYRNEMVKRSMGPQMGFVKLRLGVPREPAEVSRIAQKWTELLKTGTIDAKVIAVDRTTVMFTIPEGVDTLEVKEFVLSQPEAYEFKLGQNTWRRPGDPPLEVVVERLKKETEEMERLSKKSDKNAKEL